MASTHKTEAINPSASAPVIGETNGDARLVSDIKTITQLIDCDCGEMFESHALYSFGSVSFRQKYCQKCTARIIAETGSGVDEWPNFCPEVYRNTDTQRLIGDGKARMITLGKKPMSIEDFLAIPYSAQGLNLIGPVRQGKTRLMFKLLEGYFRQGKYFRYIYAPSFSDELAAKWSDSPKQANEWVKGFIRTGIWFLDDLGKGRLTERAQSTILRIVEERTNSGKPCHITGNASGAELARKMTGDDAEMSEYAEPLIERIREFCLSIRFLTSNDAK